MLIIFSIAVGALVLPTTLPQDVGNTPVKPLCKGGTYDEEYIHDYVVQSINDHRYTLLRGTELNGPWNGKGYGKKFPRAKTMNKLEYSCNLEKKAFALLDKSCSTNTPTGPNGTAALFYHNDVDFDDPELYSAIWDWSEQIREFAVSDDAITKKQVVYKDKDRNLYEYLTFMRAAISKIGCADITCRDGDLRKYRAVCLVNRDPLKDGDVVFKAGLGGCKNGETCRNGVCDEFGLCDLSKKAP
ncbi:hypothetical protein RB195_004513 [Necator americanus]|uniref:SCP domain-containing protein n=1 Tax=Necator americanus TaxID=51031 RepID=A0ABR1BLS9_NECAM